MSDVVLAAVPLTAEAFAPFGDVIETAGHNPRLINEGTSQRFDDLASPAGFPTIRHARAAPR